MADWNVTDTGNASTNGANLQTTINSAALGDNIILTAGASYNVPAFGLILPNKGAGTSYITITTSNTSLIPAKLLAYPNNFSFTNPNNYRVTTAEAADMPKIISTSGYDSVVFATSSHHWKFIGIEFTNTSTFTGYLVQSTTTPETQLTDYAHHIWVEKCFFHPKEETGDYTVNYQERSVEKGLGFNGNDLTVKNCAFQGFTGYDLAHSYRLDTNAIIYGSGTGNVDVENCLLEGQANNVWAGGGGSQIVPSNHTATISTPTVTSGTLSQSTDLIVGDLIAVRVTALSDVLVTTIDDPNGASPSAIVSGWGVGKVLTKSGNDITFDNLTSNYDHRVFRIKFGTGVTGGTFTLNYRGESTAAINFSSTRSTLASNIQTALENLTSLAPSDLTYVSGSAIYVGSPTYGAEVKFADSIALMVPADFTIDDTGLTGSGTVTGRIEAAASESYTQIPSGHAPSSGAAVRWRGTVPDVITIKRNIVAKHDLWYQYMGAQKGFGEMKVGTNVLFEGNIFSGQATGMIFEVKNQGGDSPWSTINNCTVRSNLWTNTASPIALAPTDHTNRTIPGSDFTISNNLMLTPAAYTGDASIFGNATSGGSNVTLTHNTIFAPDRIVFAVCGSNDDPPEASGFTQLKNWIVQDNIILQRHGLFYPVVEGTNSPYNFGDVRDAWPDMTADHNVIVDRFSEGNPSGFFTVHPSNQHPTTIAAVGFVSAPDELDYRGNYRLTADSTYHNTASDNTDPGVNYATLITALGFDPFATLPTVTVRARMKMTVL